MIRCKFEDLIDEYLFNRLSNTEKQKFEEHYFNCLSCFEKMQEQEELTEVIRSQGAMIFQDERGERESISLFEKVASFLTPKQWVLAAVSAAMLLTVIFAIIPSFKKTPPQFFLTVEDSVRGQSISLISPIIDIKTVPRYFEWKEIGDDVEYKIYVYNRDLLWSESTKKTRISPPEEIKKLMVAGQKYCWQVKAFSAQGTLIAVSSKVQFQITKAE